MNPFAAGVDVPVSLIFSGMAFDPGKTTIS
jgi:hypothetical protein